MFPTEAELPFQKPSESKTVKFCWQAPPSSSDNIGLTGSGLKPNSPVPGFSPVSKYRPASFRVRLNGVPPVELIRNKLRFSASLFACATESTGVAISSMSSIIVPTLLLLCKVAKPIRERPTSIISETARFVTCSRLR